MSPAVAEAFESVMAMPAGDRLELLELLNNAAVAETDETGWPRHLHPAWKDELARRSADLASGRTRGIPWEEVQARALEHIRRNG